MSDGDCVNGDNVSPYSDRIYIEDLYGYEAYEVIIIFNKDQYISHSPGCQACLLCCINAADDLNNYNPLPSSGLDMFDTHNAPTSYTLVFECQYTCTIT